MGRAARRLTVVLGTVGLLALAACGSNDDPGATRDRSGMGPKPWGPSSYMSQAHDLWDLALKEGKAAFWDPSTKKASTTAGDPRTYEKACGTRFALTNGTLPGWGDAPDGSSLAHLDKGFPDGSYYDWLRSDPKRWSAFNAWLLDPAVIATVAVGINPDTLSHYPNDPDAAYLQKAGFVGSTAGCPDAAAKVAALPKK